MGYRHRELPAAAGRGVGIEGPEATDHRTGCAPVPAVLRGVGPADSEAPGRPEAVIRRGAPVLHRAWPVATATRPRLPRVPARAQPPARFRTPPWLRQSTPSETHPTTAQSDREAVPDLRRTDARRPGPRPRPQHTAQGRPIERRRPDRPRLVQPRPRIPARVGTHFKLGRLDDRVSLPPWSSQRKGRTARPLRLVRYSVSSVAFRTRTQRRWR